VFPRASATFCFPSTPVRTTIGHLYEGPLALVRHYCMRTAPFPRDDPAAEAYACIRFRLRGVPMRAQARRLALSICLVMTAALPATE
jgi:hypothetical protein